MKKLLALALVLVMMLSLVACPTPPVVEDEVVLRMATGYNNTKTGITFTADSGIKEEGLKLADGKTYFTGDLKPTWAALEEILKVKFEDKFTGAGSAEKEFNVWKEKLNEVDMVSGSAAILNVNGVGGKLINLADHLDKMPNFKAYLEEVRLRHAVEDMRNTDLTITGSELTPLCRAALWYSEDVTIRDSKLHGIKALRECRNIRITDCTIASEEFGWKCDGISVTAQGDVPTLAINAPLSFESVKKSLSKFGATGFELENLEIELDDNVIVSLSHINALRREACEMLQEKLEQTNCKRCGYEEFSPVFSKKKKISLKTARFTDPSQITQNAREYFDVIYLPLHKFL